MCRDHSPYPNTIFPMLNEKLNFIQLKIDVTFSVSMDPVAEKTIIPSAGSLQVFQLSLMLMMKIVDSLLVRNSLKLILSDNNIGPLYQAIFYLAR